jgi:hypothetical protein
MADAQSSANLPRSCRVLSQAKRSLRLSASPPHRLLACSFGSSLGLPAKGFVRVTVRLGLGSETGPLPKRSGATEDRMGADSPPDDVRLTGVNFLAVLEGRATVIRPGHLPDARVPLDALDTEPGMEARSPLARSAMNCTTASRNAR